MELELSSLVQEQLILINNGQFQISMLLNLDKSYQDLKQEISIEVIQELLMEHTLNE